MSPLNLMLSLPSLMKRLTVLAVGVCFGFGFGYASRALGSTTADVSVNDNFFAPATTIINPGDSVRWTWMGGGLTSHNTTGPGTPPLWASPLTNRIGFTFTHAFPSAGSFPYTCTIHASLFNMRGT